MKRENMISGINLIWLAALALCLALSRPAVQPLAIAPYLLFVAWHTVQSIRHRFDKDGIEFAAIAAILLIGATVQVVVHHL